MMHDSIIDRNPFHDSDSVPLLEACESDGIIGAYETPSLTLLGAGPVGAAKIKTMGEYGAWRKSELSRLATGTVLGHLIATRHSRSYS